MTKSVAVARALMTSTAISLLGAVALINLFRVLDVAPLITDLQGAATRANVAWWGGIAFLACVAVTVGVIVGAHALLGADLMQGFQAWLLIAAPVAASAAGALGVLGWTEIAPAHTTTPLGLGVLIGLVSSCVYVVQRTEVSDPTPRFGTLARESKAWGSR